MAEEVAGEWPNTHVTSLADIVAPSLAGPCIDERFTGVRVNDGNPVGLVESDGDVRDQPIPSRKPRRVQALLRRLSLPKATAVAAVTANDLENISVAMTARAVHDQMHVVLRVGDGEVANETRSLLALGLVRDVHRIAAALLAAMALGREPESVVCLGDDAHLRFPDGRLERAELDTLEGSGG